MTDKQIEKIIASSLLNITSDWWNHFIDEELTTIKVEPLPTDG